jgi:hypothetical protein
MTLQDWNPLSFFKELGPLPKTVLLIGFIFLGVGIARGLSAYNRTVFLSLSMIAFSLAIHYLSNWSDPGSVSRVSISWGNILRSVVMLGVTTALLWWLWLVSGKPTLLP